MNKAEFFNCDIPTLQELQNRSPELEILLDFHCPVRELDSAIPLCILEG